MALNLSELQEPVTKESVRDTILEMLECLGFPVDSWQDESAGRSFVETQAHLIACQSQTTAYLAKMAFLQTAEDSYLDALAVSHFDTNRNPAVYSVFDVQIVNSGVINHNITPGSLLLRSSSGYIFQSNETLTASGNSTNTVEFTAQLPGASGNVPAQTFELVTPLAGVTAVYDGGLVIAGADTESDTNLRTRCASKWGALRVEKIDTGLVSLAREASASVHGVSIDSDNPRGPGTVDVYLSSQNGSVGGADVALVQTALNGSLFGTGTEEPAGLAIAAPTQVVNLQAVVYVKGVSADEVASRLTQVWRDFLLEIPVGGFDLRPGPTNVIQKDQITSYLNKNAYSTKNPIVSIGLTQPAADVNVGLHTKVIEGAVSFSVVQVN